MRLQSILITSAVVLLALGVGAVLVARKYRILGVELTRNAEANSKSREQKAHETLRRLAADPKLTVVTQRSQDVGGKRNPVVLCVLSRHVLGMLVKPTDSAQAANQPLLQRLDTVDVEPVPYEKTELPNLIAEITAVQGDNPSSPLTTDLTKLLASLQKENAPGYEVVFY
jgi:hypothetical protein